MKTFLSVLKFTFIILIIVLLSYLVPFWVGLERLNTNPVLFFLRIILIGVWLAGITYKIAWDKSQIKLAKTKIIFFLFLIFSVIIVWFFNTTYTLTKFYLHDIKKPTRGWKGKVHQIDPVLGFKPIPGSHGFHTFPIGESIPMMYDENGFRVPLNYNHISKINNKPRILFLGCSYTYGDACYAEQTFPFLVEKDLGGYVINAGVCSYGLSQMYILLQKLVPIYKPDIVIFQHSDWLVDRAVRCFAPIYYSVLPTPYFDKKNEVISPLFTSNIFNYSFDDYKQTPKSFSEFSSFFSTSIKLYMEDDLKKFIADTKRLFFLVPKPATDKKNVEQFVFRQAQDICKKNNCQLFVLNLRETKYPLEKLENAIVINADSCLQVNIGRNEAMNKYYHYRMSGKDSIIVDYHPNPLAHTIIAKEIVRVIKVNNLQQ